MAEHLTSIHRAQEMLGTGEIVPWKRPPTGIQYPVVSPEHHRVESMKIILFLLYTFLSLPFLPLDSWSYVALSLKRKFRKYGNSSKSKNAPKSEDIQLHKKYKF